MHLKKKIKKKTIKRASNMFLSLILLYFFLCFLLAATCPCLLTEQITKKNKIKSGMFMGNIFNNVATNATRTKSSIRLFTTSCIIMLEYWQFQCCTGNHYWFTVNILSYPFIPIRLGSFVFVFFFIYFSLLSLGRLEFHI